MIRELFHIGPLSISPFGVMMVAAFLAAFWLLRWGLQKTGAGTEEDASSILLAGGIGGILGAKVYYSLLYGDWSQLFQRYGLVWYGGFFLGLAAILWVVRRRRLSAWPVADVAAPALALGYGIGRIGCFLVGDDYGLPTNMPWGVKFPYGLPGPTTAGFLRSEYGADIPYDIAPDQLVAVHPTQLYETLAALVICWLGMALFRRAEFPGRAALAVFGLLAVERFTVEFFRAKDDRFLGEMTIAQLLSLGVLAVVVTLWVWRKRRLERMA